MSGRTLLIKTGALGDTVLSLPLVRALRQSGGPVDVMGREDFWTVALQPGYADRVFSIDRFDLSPLFAGNSPVPETLSTFLSGYERVIAFWQRDPDVFARGLLRAGARSVHVAKPFLENHALAARGLHAADHLLEAVPSLPAVDSIPRFLPSPDDQDAANRIVQPPYIVIHPGSGSPRKNWAHGVEAVGRLAAALDLPAVVPVGPADESWADLLSKPAIQPAPELIRHASVRALGAILAQATVYVGNDSGVTHLAAAAGAPVVAIFGPTDPRAWGPRGERVRVLRSRDEAMRTPEIAEVARAVRDVLAGAD